MQMLMNPKELLINLGFIESATPKISGESWEFSITQNKNAANILYAFIFFTNEEDESVVYIGHSRKQFDKRLYGYQYGGGRAVNNRIHRAVSNQLRQGGQVKVLCLPNSFQFCMQTIPVDLAAGLEYGLINHIAEFNKQSNLRALYNIAGNRYWREAENPPQLSEAEALQAERIDEEPVVLESNLPEELTPILAKRIREEFEVILQLNTYWDQAFINAPARVTDYFGPEDDTVLTLLSETNGTYQSVRGTVRRRNNNGYPRLFFLGENRNVYQDWKIRNHENRNPIVVRIMDRNEIVFT